MFVHHRRMDDSSQTRFFPSVLLLAIALTAGPVAAKEINVPDDESTIQAAIDAAESGDTILVEPDTYRETLTIQGKSDLILRGRETARTFLKPATSSIPILTIDGSSGITIHHFTFLQADSGISVTNTSDFSIAANVFHLGSSGIAVTVNSDKDGDIINNTFYKNKVGAKRAASDTRIKNNLFADNETAISNSSADATNITYNGYYSNTDDGVLGTENVTLTDPLFVSVDNEDFHLQLGSPAINTGHSASLEYDGTKTDLGAYGGADADTYPYPVATLNVSTASINADTYSVSFLWNANTDHRVTGYYLDWYIEGDASTPSTRANIVTTTTTLDGTVPDITAPAKPDSLSVTPRNQTLIIAWPAVTGATGYELRYGVTSVDENTPIDVGNVLSYTLSGLTNGTEYTIHIHAVAQATLHATVTAHDDYVHESYIKSNEIEQAIGPEYSSDPVEGKGMPEATVSYPLLPNEGCFIATAAYGHYSAPQVQALREFRDQYLIPYSAGRSFVRWYYAHGPSGARVLNEHPILKLPVRVILYPLVLGALFLTQTPAWMQLLTVFTLLLFSSMVIHRYKKRTPCAGMPH